MSFRDRMKAKRKKLGRAHNKQNPDAVRSSYPTIFVKKEIPDGVEFFRPPEGRTEFDIIPFEAGPDMPFDPSTGEPVSEEGDLAYKLELFVHYDIGSGKKPFVCPADNFGEPCPICEFRNAQRLPTEEWKKLKPKQRVLYLVWVHDEARKEEKKGVQILEMAHFNSEEKFLEVARLPRGGGFVNYGDYENGKTMFMTRKGTGMTNTQYLGHNFTDRVVKLSDKILDSSFSVDQVVNMHPTYEEIEKEFRGMKSTIKLENGDNVPLDDADDEMGDDVFPEDVPSRRSRGSKSSGRSRGQSTRSRKSENETKETSTRTRGRGKSSSRSRRRR